MGAVSSDGGRGDAAAVFFCGGAPAAVAVARSTPSARPEPVEGPRPSAGRLLRAAARPGSY